VFHRLTGADRWVSYYGRWLFIVSADMEMRYIIMKRRGTENMAWILRYEPKVSVSMNRVAGGGLLAINSSFPLARY